MHLLAYSCHNVCLHVRGQIVGVGSLLSPCGFRESTSGFQVWKANAFTCGAILDPKTLLKASNSGNRDANVEGFLHEFNK